MTGSLSLFDRGDSEQRKFDSELFDWKIIICRRAGEANGEESDCDLDDQ